MITTANFIRQMLLVSLLVMAATGRASASSSAEESVRAQVDALANAGIASANKNDCVSAGKYAAQITAFLKQNRISISVFENNHTAIEQEMQTRMVNTLRAIQACEMRASASTSVPDIPPPVQRPPQPAPNYATPSTTSSAAGQNGTAAGSWEDVLAAEKREDWKAAYLLARPLAMQGNSEAQLHIGFMYETGKGVRQDYQEAASWYSKSAAQGNANAQSNLGLAYENGRGVPKDNLTAAQWFRKSADQGNSDGQRYLGSMYLDGEGVRRDYAEAIKWFRKSADQGDTKGQLNLGYMYENGYGVPQDYTTALKWYRKAADGGDEDGKNYFTNLSRQIKEEAFNRTPEGRKKQCLDNCNSAKYGCETANNIGHNLIGGWYGMMSQKNCGGQLSNCIESCNR